MRVLSNATISPFVIRNNISVDAPSPVIDVWSPWVQLRVNDGNADRSSNNGVAVFRYGNEFRFSTSNIQYTDTCYDGLILYKWH